MDTFLCVFLSFSCLAPDDDFRTVTDVLASFWKPVCAQFLFAPEMYSHWTLFSDLLKSDPSFLFFSLHVFQLLANHFLFSESNVLVPAQWGDLLVKAKEDSKAFSAVLDQNQLMRVRGMDAMCEVCEMLSAHLTFTQKSLTAFPCQ